MSQVLTITTATSHLIVLFLVLCLSTSLGFVPEFQTSLADPQLRNSLILVSLQESPTHSTKPMLFLLFLWSAHWNVEEVGLAFKGRAEKLFRDKSSRNHSRVVRIGA